MSNAPTTASKTVPAEIASAGTSAPVTAKWAAKMPDATAGQILEPSTKTAASARPLAGQIAVVPSGTAANVRAAWPSPKHTPNIRARTTGFPAFVDDIAQDFT